mmetsp:Transcript_18107/g.44738  ORF Transcript_18107/g.44738 Transcript_18107/m.44738 type:complete len:210 (-) Transcript_18107:668-1297(-)
MWLISSARPDCSVAATESPPPITVMVPFSLVKSAMMLTKSKVPLANFSNSKTPIGPFMIMVLQVERAAFCSSVVLGPLSRPIQPSGMASTATTLESASSANLSAITMSLGSKMVLPMVLAFSRTPLAVSTKSSSTKEVPTPSPLAFKKVKTMPPPIIMTSHLSRRASRTVILEETLEPPTMAAMGAFPLLTAPSRYSSSLAKRNPETDG